MYYPNSISNLIDSLKDEFLQKKKISNLVSTTQKPKDVKAYKNLYIFIIIHPKQHVEVANALLSNINYLSQMTRDVVFTMPGYKPAKEGDEIVNTTDKNMPLIFDENLFIEIIQDLENKSNNNFLYKKNERNTQKRANRNRRNVYKRRRGLKNCLSFLTGKAFLKIV